MQYSSRGLAVFLLMIAGLAYSQEKLATDFSETGKLTAWMKEKLSLSELQVPRVEDINVKYTQKSLVLQTGFLTRKQKLEIIQANEIAKDEELKKILTSEQFMVWQSKKKEIEGGEKKRS